ncbi:MAG: hypothetical protein GX230_10640 [Lentisphaerae bacterium]|jgi:hypothetical protein|nr:hypothetical protein [Lentisphaerota bacterium]
MEGSNKIVIDSSDQPLSHAEMEIEREKIELERERMLLERERLAAERERWRVEASWRRASERTVRIRLGTTFLACACCLLLGCLLGGLWMATQHSKSEAARRSEVARQRQELVQAFSGKTNFTEQAGALFQKIGDASGSGSGGILLILD